MGTSEASGRTPHHLDELPLSHKVHPPGLPRHVVTRARLDSLFEDVLGRYGVVELVGGPGTGKTVQAQLFAARSGMDVCWLTADRGDRSPSTLVFDLTKALNTVAPDGLGTVLRAIRANRSVEEAAALLAGTITTRALLLVIDDCHEIAKSADSLVLLDSFVEYLPRGVRLLLVSRCDLPWPLLRRRLNGNLGRLSAEDLNLTYEETIEYLRESGSDPDAAEQVYQATGGWIAGAAFAARYGVAGNSRLRDLSEYMASQVFDPLPPDEQAFLTQTSVLDVVTLEEAIVLCGFEARRTWADLLTRNLPATTVAENRLTYHSLFRDFLRQRLLAAGPERYNELLCKHAEYLARNGRYDEATERWISVSQWDRAAETMSLAIGEKYTRADWTTVMRWIEVLGESRIYPYPLLVGGWIRAVAATRPWQEAANLIRRLASEGSLSEALKADRGLVATAAWVMQAYPAEALQLLDEFEGDHRADAVRYLIDTTIGTEPAVPPYGESWNEAERALTWGLLLQGRCADLLKLLPRDANESIINPNLLIGYLLQNDVSVAWEAYRRIPSELREQPDVKFVEVVLCAMSERYDDAERLVTEVTVESRVTGFALAPAYTVFAAWVLLMKGHADRAEEILRSTLETMSLLQTSAYVEWTQCVQAIAFLKQGRTEQSRLLLRDVASSMQRSHRRLLLSLTATALSEAEYLCGDAVESGKWAEVAYRTAEKTDNYLLLNWGVKLFPDVRRRQMAQAPGDDRWRRLIATPSVRLTSTALTEMSEVGISLRLQPFGPSRDLEINGSPCGVGRIKVLEFVACLARKPDGLDRRVLREMLFPEATPQNGGNYFRQIAHLLRSLGVALRRRGNQVSFGAEVAVTTADVEFETLIYSSNRFDKQERAERLVAALGMVDGDYLEDSRLSWVEDLRSHLALVLEEARLELASLRIDAGDREDARAQCEAVIAANRYADPAYRLLVSIERRTGSESSVLAVYQRAVSALSELGLRPGDARRLLDHPLAPVGTPVQRTVQEVGERPRALRAGGASGRI